MTTAIASASPSYGALTRYLPTILRYKQTLRPEPSPAGTFPGGLVWRMGDEDDHYVVILLPPTEQSFGMMGEYLGFPDDWRIVTHEILDQVEAVHVMAPSRP